MQMTSALHLVPDPDDETPPPDTAGEKHPTPEPTPAAPAVEEEPGEELHDADEADEEPDDEVGEDDEEHEEPAPRRVLAMPDLRPYADVTAVPQVISAGVEATRRARANRAERRKGRPRRLLAIAVDVAAGTVLLLRHGVAWLGGDYGPASVKGPGRIGLAFLGGYFAYRTVDTWPLYGTTGLAAVWLGAALGERHRQRAEAAEDVKKKTKGKAGKSSPKAAAKDAEDGDQEAAEKTPARRSWWSRITSPGEPDEAPADTPEKDAGDSPDEAADEGEEEAPAEAAAEPPAPPSREVIAGALHQLYRGGSGVLLTTLRQHLSQPHTRAVREVLGAAGIRVREGVRTPGGNGPGVHTHDFPPLPPSPDPSPGDVVCAGESTNNNNANTESDPQKGLDADGTYWPPGRPYYFEPDPANPHGTRIVYPREP
ncbi:hypothetical protein [Streptomyces sp. SAI-127]|uniref:hypothetical protein n=1 Tax=Streptomyces sp. SAI-127 TaxID=2940543 RepID=UPI0024739281|nr:hypothetical protein [Streptomyces sp. SAI-127]MDH6489619.1 hypothetical protein [Streptomyces sp. SAI-127]